VPKAVLRLCPACDQPTTGAEVVPEQQLLRCDLCGAQTRFKLLPPLLFLTGASGAGKTTLYRHLLGRVREAILIDHDLLWGLDPAHDDPATGYRRFRGLVLHLAERLALNGKPVLVEGTCVPEQYESLGERWYFAKTAYAAVVCDDDELARRLRARPAWRDSARTVETMVQVNRSLRDDAFDPPLRLIDTTHRPIPECAAELHRWIRESVRVGTAAPTFET
jgi:hypothetical protein